MLLEMSYSFEGIWNIIAPILWKILEVIAVFYIGNKCIKISTDLIKKVTAKADLEKGVVSFICSLVKIVLYVFLVVIIAGIFGIPTASFVAVIGSCGLAIGLALQGSLQNFAGGVLILVMKPFKVGDYIVVNGLEGSVASIDICYTKLRTVDNKIVVLPNGTLSNSNLTNVSREPKRRVDIIVPIGYWDDIRSVKSMLSTIAEGTEKILKSEPIDIFVSDFGDDSIEMGFRVWVDSADYWAVKWELLEKIKYAMDEKGFSIPFHQIDVTMKEPKK